MKARKGKPTARWGRKVMDLPFGVGRLPGRRRMACGVIFEGGGTLAYFQFSNFNVGY
jgi:hypothetical protein